MVLKHKAEAPEWLIAHGANIWLIDYDDTDDETIFRPILKAIGQDDEGIFDPAYVNYEGRSLPMWKARDE